MLPHTHALLATLQGPLRWIRAQSGQTARLIPVEDVGLPGARMPSTPRWPGATYR